MANALLVVGDDGALTAGDNWHLARLAAVGYASPTVVADDATVPAGPFDVIVLSQTCSSSALTTRYTDLASPVVTANNGGMLTRLNLASANGGKRSSAIDDAILEDHPINAGYTSPLTFIDTRVTRRNVAKSALPSGVDVVWTDPDDSTGTMLIAAEAGATATSGTFPARRAGAMMYEDDYLADINADGIGIWEQLLTWAIGTSETTSVTATRATTWTAHAAITATRATTWDVDATSTITATRATTWTTRDATTQTRATTWNVGAISSISASRATTWTTRAATSPTTRATTWATIHNGPALLYLADAVAEVLDGSDTSAARLRPILIDAGYDYRLQAIGDGPPADAADLALIIIDNSVPAATSMTEWDAVAVPKLATGVRSPATGYATTGSSDATTSLTTTWLLDADDPIVPDGQAAGSVAIHQTAPPKTRYVAASALGSGAVAVTAYDASHTSQIQWSRYEVGAVMASGTAGARMVWALSHPADYNDTGLGFYDAALAWLLEEPVTASRATTWITRGTVTATRTSTWETRAVTAAATRSTTWTTRAPVTGSRATSWDVDATGTVTASRATTWTTRARATTTRATSWTVRTPITGSRTTTWDYLHAATTNRATTWATLRAITATRASTWTSRASLTTDRSTTWDVQQTGHVAGSRATTWTTRAIVTGSRATMWDQLAAVAATRATSWGTLDTAAATRATAWTVKAAITASKATSWDVESETPPPLPPASRTLAIPAENRVAAVPAESRVLKVVT